MKFTTLEYMCWRGQIQALIIPSPFGRGMGRGSDARLRPFPSSPSQGEGMEKKSISSFPFPKGQGKNYNPPPNGALPHCLSEISSDVSSCPSCGHSFDDATRRFDSRARQTASTSFDSIDDARFVPGDILSDRYRIVGLIGKGGMGEVYRADDLKMGNPSR